MLKRKIRMELNEQLYELKMNLENNYKDLAKDALKDLHEMLEQYLLEGKMKEKDYHKYKEIANAYSKKMEHYHH